MIIKLCLFLTALCYVWHDLFWTFTIEFLQSHIGPVSKILCQKKFKTLSSAHNSSFVYDHYLCYMSCNWWGMSLGEWEYTHVVYDIMEMVRCWWQEENSLNLVSVGKVRQLKNSAYEMCVTPNSKLPGDILPSYTCIV